MIDMTLIIKRIKEVEDDGYCDKFKLDKRVYRESNCLKGIK